MGMAFWRCLRLAFKSNQEAGEADLQTWKNTYWVKIDGCQYGLEWKGLPLKKSWTILTLNRNLWLTWNKRCDRTREHAECRGPAAEESSYYSKM